MTSLFSESAHINKVAANEKIDKMNIIILFFNNILKIVFLKCSENTKTLPTYDSEDLHANMSAAEAVCCFNSYL